jgi:hypothetical protein
MGAWMQRGVVVAAWLVVGGSWASGQVVERDTTITGPRGRTLQRQVTTQRGPGFVERDIRIQRPGGATFQRDTRVQARGPVGGPLPGPRFGPRPAYFGPRPWGPREVIINNRGGGLGVGPAIGLGLGSFALGALAGTALASPPTPVYVAPAPVYVAPAPPPAVVYNPPVRYGQPAAPPTVVVDPVATELARLQSYHGNSRRDGALALGRLGDARAVPSLIDRLKNDYDKDVRVAAAWALGEIGDPQAAVALQRAALYDRRSDVRDVASRAYARLPRDLPATPPGAAAPVNPTTASASNGPSLSTPTVPSPTPPSELPPPPPEPPPSFPDRP